MISDQPKTHVVDCNELWDILTDAGIVFPDNCTGFTIQADINAPPKIQFRCFVERQEYDK